MRQARLATSRPAACAAATLLPLLLAVAPVGSAAAQGSASSTRPSSTAPPPAGWSRAPRWQANLHDGTYLWEIRPTELRGDTLVVRQADSVVRVPLERVDELRLVRPSVKTVQMGGAARATFGGLAGADDAVYTLARFPMAERRRIVEEILAGRLPGNDSTAVSP